MTSTRVNVEADEQVDAISNSRRCAAEREDQGACAHGDLSLGGFGLVPASAKSVSGWSHNDRCRLDRVSVPPTMTVYVSSMYCQTVLKYESNLKR